MQNSNPSLNLPSESGPPAPLKVRKDTKRWGDIGELSFTLKAASLGICASKPYGDRRPYDFLVECGPHLWRVQVKSVFTTNLGSHRYGFPVAVSQHRLRGRATYTPDEIDFIAAFVAPHDAWYVIPVDALSHRKFIRLYPGGKKRRDAGRYEQYREAWHLMSLAQADTEESGPP